MSHETMLDINNIVAAITECNSYIVKTDFLFSNRDIDAEYKRQLIKILLMISLFIIKSTLA